MKHTTTFLTPSRIALAAAALCTSLAHAAPVEDTPAAEAPAIQDTTPAGALATVEI